MRAEQLTHGYNKWWRVRNRCGTYQTRSMFPKQKQSNRCLHDFCTNSCCALMSQFCGSSFCVWQFHHLGFRHQTTRHHWQVCTALMSTPMIRSFQMDPCALELLTPSGPSPFIRPPCRTKTSTAKPGWNFSLSFPTNACFVGQFPQPFSTRQQVSAAL